MLGICDAELVDQEFLWKDSRQGDIIKLALSNKYKQRDTTESEILEGRNNG